MSKYNGPEWKITGRNKTVIGTEHKLYPVIAECFFDCDLPKALARKNAKLIAAAPDLLNACIALVAIMKQESEDYYFK